MAQFDESKVISPLHPKKAEIGKQYWGSYILLELKKRVEENIKEYIGELDRIDYVALYPYEIKNINRWQFLYPYEDTSYQGMTNLQLAEWLAKGNGQWKWKQKYDSNTEMYVCTAYVYDICDENKQPNNIVIRPFGTDEWVTPTVAIYERDCKQ